MQNGTLIKPQTFELMSQRQKTNDGQQAPYGLGWFVAEREGGCSGIWHGGAQQGATSDLWILPEKQFALALLVNMEGGGRLGLAALANQIADVVLQ